MNKGYTYDFYKEAATYIEQRISKAGCSVPRLAIVLGTGCSPFAQRLDAKVSIPYGEIPGFPTATNPSHKGELVIGSIGDTDVLCMNGRMHFYEGYSMEELGIPVHVMHVLGIRTLVLTNASGSCDPEVKPGDVVVVKDHIKLYGGSPMRGSNVPELGPRFFSVKDMYTKRLRRKALELAKGMDLNVHEGVYMFFPGPQFETASEINAARILGANVVGMSTVTEALTAAHCGMELLALSLVTNMATGMDGAFEGKNDGYDDGDGDADESVEGFDEVSEVDVVAAKASDSFSGYLGAIVGALAGSD